MKFIANADELQGRGILGLVAKLYNLWLCVLSAPWKGLKGSLISLQVICTWEMFGVCLFQCFAGHLLEPEEYLTPTVHPINALFGSKVPWVNLIPFRSTQIVGKNLLFSFWRVSFLLPLKHWALSAAHGTWLEHIVALSTSETSLCTQS